MTWQERLDELFPDGVLVTVVTDVPEYTEGDPSFLTPKLMVRKEGDRPEVRFQIIEFEKDVTFVIESMEEMRPGVWLVHSERPQTDFILSNVFGPSVREFLKRTRQEWYGEEVV